MEIRKNPVANREPSKRDINDIYAHNIVAASLSDCVFLAMMLGSGLPPQLLAKQSSASTTFTLSGT